jgi:8-hydroxy-5-deazaflavin:NADPH oxidoreductase
MTETHAVRLADGQIIEQVVGDNSFHMPHQELVAWQMPFAEAAPDQPRRSRRPRHGQRPSEDQEVATVEIGIIGVGRIGGGLARQLAAAGHQVLLSFSRDRAALDERATQIGPSARTGSPADAVAFGEVIVISVPWSVLPLALEQAGPLDGKIVIDTTNQFGGPPLPPEGQTAARFNAARMPGARYTKSFNTLTAGFQAAVAGRRGDERVVQWLCGDDDAAKEVVAGLIRDAGFVPVDLDGTAGCAVMEAPRRPGAVYGEEYRLADAKAVLDALRAGRLIPPTPQYH